MFRIMKRLFLLELLLLIRRPQIIFYPLFFFLIVICLFPFALTPDVPFLQTYIPGCIWIAALLASLLSIEQVFHADTEDGCLDQQLLAHVPFGLLISMKLIAFWIVTQLPLILLVPLLGLLFHLSLSVTLALALGLLLGTPVLVLLGALGIALTFGLKQQGVLLSLLILPLVTPLIILGVMLVQFVQRGWPIIGMTALMGGICLFAMTCLPWVIAGAVQIGVE